MFSKTVGIFCSLLGVYLFCYTFCFSSDIKLGTHIYLGPFMVYMDG